MPPVPPGQHRFVIIPSGCHHIVVMLVIWSHIRYTIILSLGRSALYNFTIIMKLCINSRDGSRCRKFVSGRCCPKLYNMIIKTENIFRSVLPFRLALPSRGLPCHLPSGELKICRDRWRFVKTDAWWLIWFCLLFPSYFPSAQLQTKDNKWKTQATCPDGRTAPTPAGKVCVTPSNV